MTQWAHLHRRSILFALMLFAVAGFFVIFSTPVSLFPQVTFPRVVINLDAGDMPAERMAVQVTWPVEEAVRAVPGVLTVRSATSRGSADISINFVWGTEMVSAMLQVESALNQIRSTLPRPCHLPSGAWIRRYSPCSVTVWYRPSIPWSNFETWRSIK